MKLKTFEVEVVRTCTVKVTLPEALCTPESIKEWESCLWKLRNGIDSIAEYAANMAVNYAGYNHDGVGQMIENNFTKPDYEKDPYQVIAIIDEDDTEVRVLNQGEWEGAKHNG